MTQNDKECPSCEGFGDCWACEGKDPECTVCDGLKMCPRCEGEGTIVEAGEDGE